MMLAQGFNIEDLIGNPQAIIGFLVVIAWALSAIGQVVKGNKDRSSDKGEIDIDVPQPPQRPQAPRVPRPPQSSRPESPSRTPQPPGVPRPPRPPRPQRAEAPRQPQPLRQARPAPAPIQARESVPPSRHSRDAEGRRLAHERERAAAEALRKQQAEIERQNRLRERAEALKQRTAREDHDVDRRQRLSSSTTKVHKRRRKLSTVQKIDRVLSNRNGFAAAFLMSEILGPPIGMKADHLEQQV
jgi:type IV secretory pathway VirB10-like protein